MVTGEKPQHTTSSRPEVDLRPFTGDDREFFTALATDRRVTRFIGDGAPWSESRILDRVRLALRETPTSRDGAVRWFIAESGGAGVGLFVTSRHADTVEIGYRVSPGHWGRGLAGTMLSAGLQTVAGVYSPGTMVARIDPANAASIRAVRRQGFTFGGTDGQLERYIRQL